MSTETSNIAEALAGSGATRLHALSFGGGRQATIWRNGDGRMRYHVTRCHTVSLYLRGGEGTRRLDRAASRGDRQGGEGRICVLPQGSSSDWAIGPTFEFIHLYLPDAELRGAVSAMFDCDARCFDVAELTYVEDAAIAAAMRRLARATQEGDALMADGAVADILHDMTLSLGGLRRAPAPLRGGLAPHVSRRLRDYMTARLDQPVRLRDLAEEAGYSEHHLQRMFLATHGLSPHQWLERARIDRARVMIAEGAALAEISAACGFSNQSHFTRAFARVVGLSPGRYRRSLGAAGR